MFFYIQYNCSSENLHYWFILTIGSCSKRLLISLIILSLIALFSFFSLKTFLMHLIATSFVSLFSFFQSKKISYIFNLCFLLYLICFISYIFNILYILPIFYSRNIRNFCFSGFAIFFFFFNSFFFIFL